MKEFTSNSLKVQSALHSMGAAAAKAKKRGKLVTLLNIDKCLEMYIEVQKPFQKFFDGGFIRLAPILLNDFNMKQIILSKV